MGDALDKKPQSYLELVTLFGDPGEFGKDASTRAVWEQKFMTLWRVDVWKEKHPSIFLPPTLPFSRMYVNRILVPVIDKALELLVAKGIASEIKTFDGCWNIRPIRGTENLPKPRWSIHSFACAFDLNAARNPLGGPTEWSDEFLDTMIEAGFTVGADFKREDGMHFQYADNC